MFRILVGVFTLTYLLVRLPVFVALTDRPDDAFDPVGVFSFVGSPLPGSVVIGLIVAAIASGAFVVLGAWFRVAGPVFALTMLALITYRSSWGQLLHFEHLPVLHLFVIAWTPAADAFSLDARRRDRHDRPDRPPNAHGWPLALCALILVSTYVIAGIAKLRYGGIDWIVGDTLRNHVAYSAARLDVLGGDPSPVAEPAMRAAWLFPFAAAGSVLIELAAPVALFGGRTRTVWVVAAWTMHIGIFALMLVGFPYPLFLIAFAPLYHLERIAEWVRTARATIRSAVGGVRRSEAM